MTHWKLESFATRPATALVLPSQRGLQPYKNLREATKSIYGSYSYANARTLTEELGPYFLDDTLTTRLRRAGLLVPKDGQIRVLSMQTYLDAALLDRAEQDGLTVPAMCIKLKELSPAPLTLFVAESSLPTLQTFLRVWAKDLDYWQQLECIDALECHHNPYLAFL